MPLIPCPDCDRQCSTTADFCPQCGYRFTKSSNLAGGISALGSSLKNKIKPTPKKYTFPLSIGKHFILNKDTITFKNKHFDIVDDLARLKFKTTKGSAANISIGTQTELIMEMFDGTKIKVSAGSVRSREKCKRLEVAGNYISKITHNSRYQYYLDILTEDKKLSVEGITIHSDGYISKGMKKIDLVESYENGCITKGVHRYAIVVVTWSDFNPSALTITSGTGMFSKKIIAEFKYDSDALNRLILEIAKNPIH